MNMNYALRIDKLRQKLNKYSIDAMFVSSPQNCMYMSGFTGTSGFLFISQYGQYLFTDFRYAEQAKQETHSYEIIETKSKSFAELKKLVDKQNIISLGFESHKLSYDKYNEISGILQGIKLCPTDKIIESIREIKDKEEIRSIQTAAQIASAVFDSIIKMIKPGVAENEIAAELEYLMKKYGAKDRAFNTIVASGKRSSMPHGTATNKKIEMNDVVVLDYGAEYQGYCSDITRTVFVGDTIKEFEKIYKIVLEAQLEALQNIKPGVPGKNIDEISRNIISKYGYGEYFGHGLGHGVGIEVHETVKLSPCSDTILQENMVVTVEPGIYLADKGGVRIEDTVVVTHDGVKLLTDAPKNSIVIV